jgi:protein TonB
MMRLDFLLFLGLATAAHLAVLPAPDPSGRAGGGAEGKDSVTLAASAPTALVDQWQTRPDQAEAPDMASPATGQPPARPTAETAAKPTPRPAQPEGAAETPALPRVPQPAPTPTRPESSAPGLPLPEVDARPAAPAEPEHRADATRPSALAQPDPPARPQVDSAAPPPPADSDLAPERAPRPAARPRPAQPAQVATGTETGETTGATAPQVSQGPDAATTRRLMAQWGSGVHRAIERRKAYPRGTRASGTARIRLTLSGDGQLRALGVASSSGDARLDRAARAAVRAARYPAAPEALGTGPHSFTVPLSFEP